MVYIWLKTSRIKEAEERVEILETAVKDLKETLEGKISKIKEGLEYV